MAEDLIGYDRLIEDAKRTVVRSALQIAASPGGLPGKHHFYITFRTHGPGVIIPEHLANRYPDEMTIVLEHQFWDLEVFPDRFRVILKFSGQPHPIVIPFSQITRFLDPHVKQGLQFDSRADEARMVAGDEAAVGNAAPPATSQDPEPAPSSSGGVVSLDAFRNKK